MDSNDSRQIRSEWDANEVRQAGHRRNDPEEPWYWTRIGNVEGLGDWQDAGDDIRRRQRMAEAMYEC